MGNCSSSFQYNSNLQMNDAFAHQEIYDIDSNITIEYNLRLKICEKAAIWLQILLGAWSRQLLLLKEWHFTKETKDKWVKPFHSWKRHLRKTSTCKKEAEDTQWVIASILDVNQRSSSFNWITSIQLSTWKWKSVHCWVSDDWDKKVLSMPPSMSPLSLGLSRRWNARLFHVDYQLRESWWWLLWHDDSNTGWIAWFDFWLWLHDANSGW